MKTADEFLAEAAETFKARNKIYDNNYKNVGRVLAGMFPEGLVVKTADDWNRLHIFLLGVVKQTRYANNWNAGGHADSAHDNTVYSAMLESIDEEIAQRGKEGLKIDFGSGDCNVVCRIVVGDESISTMALCTGCGTPETCIDQFKCLKIKTFEPCNYCSTTKMCTDEDHCDHVSNGYR